MVKLECAPNYNYNMAVVIIILNILYDYINCRHNSVYSSSIIFLQEYLTVSKILSVYDCYHEIIHYFAKAFLIS